MERTLKPYEQEIVDLLWDYLKRDPEHKDRRKTGYGTKTKIGLVNTIAWIRDKHTRSEDESTN